MKPYFETARGQLFYGDSLKRLSGIESESAQCCITSPPYWGLRNYGVDGQLGLEKTPEEYVSKMVEIFREVRRVLRKDGTLWLNLGDSYATHSAKRSGQFGKEIKKGFDDISTTDFKSKGAKSIGLKEKDLCGIPWRVAFALQSDVWYLRQDIIWHKPNPMPESVTDRCTKAHEYIFLMSKAARYCYNNKAIAEKSVCFSSDKRSEFGRTPHKSGKSIMKESQYAINGVGYSKDGTRNKRSVWTVPTKPYKEAHFATFPPALILPCILAGTAENQTILDPFMGAGTVASVCEKYNRNWIGIELNKEYCQLTKTRIINETRQLKLFNNHIKAKP